MIPGPEPYNEPQDTSPEPETEVAPGRLESRQKFTESHETRLDTVVCAVKLVGVQVYGVQPPRSCSGLMSGLKIPFKTTGLASDGVQVASPENFKEHGGQARLHAGLVWPISGQTNLKRDVTAAMP
jgi:hypothetical protein